MFNQLNCLFCWFSSGLPGFPLFYCRSVIGVNWTGHMFVSPQFWLP